MSGKGSAQRKPACIILAGGQSTRMGSDKALLPLPGSPHTTFAAHLVSLCMSLTDEVLLVARDAGAAESYARSLSPAPRIVYDQVPDQGPLIGLYSGLSSIEASHALVLAVDLPALQPALAAFLMSLPQGDELIVPLVHGFPQVLLALYPRSSLPLIESCIQQGYRSPRALLKLTSIHYLEEEQLRPYDPELRSFLNVNTPQDLQQL